MINSTLYLIAILGGAIAVVALIFFITSIHSKYLSFNNDSESKLIPRIHLKNTEQKFGFEASQPLFIRISWPLIILIGSCVIPFVTWGVRQRLSRSITQAGLYGWTYENFLSLQILLAGIAIVFSFVLTAIVFSFQFDHSLFMGLSCALLASLYPRVWLRSKKTRRYQEIEKGLPFFLDMVTLGLEAGMNLQSAIQLSLDHLHAGSLKEEWIKTIFEIRSGVTRAEAFRNMSQRVELACIRQMVIAFIQGESMGLSLSKSIGEFSRQQGQFRLLRAEKIALQAPVKMLFPLAFCIFPCTFLVLGFPVVAQLMGLGS